MEHPCLSCIVSMKAFGCSPFFCSSQSIFIIFQPSSFTLPLSNFGQLALPLDINWGKNLNSPDELLSFCPLSFTWSALPDHLYNEFFWWPLSYHSLNGPAADSQLGPGSNWASLWSMIHASIHTILFNYCSPAMYFNYLVELVVDLMLDFFLKGSPRLHFSIFMPFCTKKKKKKTHWNFINTWMLLEFGKQYGRFLKDFSVRQSSPPTNWLFWL